MIPFDLRQRDLDRILRVRASLGSEDRQHIFSGVSALPGAVGPDHLFCGGSAHGVVRRGTTAPTREQERLEDNMGYGTCSYSTWVFPKSPKC